MAKNPPGKRYTKIRVIRGNDGQSREGLPQGPPYEGTCLAPVGWGTLFIGAFFCIMLRQKPEKRIGDWLAGTLGGSKWGP